MNEVIEFIRKRFNKDNHWLDGNCYYFAIILRDRFNGTIYYDKYNSHFITKIDGSYYDYSGKIKPDERDILNWKELETSNPSYYSKIKKECIL